MLTLRACPAISSGQIKVRARYDLRDDLAGVQAGGQFRGGNAQSGCQSLVDRIVQHAVQSDISFDRHTGTGFKFSQPAAAIAGQGF